MQQFILEKEKSYTFSDFFEIGNPTREIAAAFGYQFQLKKIDLPVKKFDGSLKTLKNNFYTRLPRISLNSEAAKREVMVAPILLELLDHLDLEIDIEYPLNVSDQLKGTIDYYLRSKQNLIIIEAKKSDIEKGFSQLVVELIAFDNVLDSNASIYGAVTAGDIWKFGVLNTREKLISKDIDSFRVPLDIEDLFSVFTGILS